MHVRRLTPDAPGAVDAAVMGFDCCRERRRDDPVAHEVNAFLRGPDWRHGHEHGHSTTYLFLDDDDEAERALIGYVTLAISSIRLSEAERAALGRPNFPTFGAVRLVMIGTDADLQGQGYGDTMLKWVVGRSRFLSKMVAFRFIVADVNVTQKSWYDKRQFQVNRSKIENPDDAGRSTISMRLDLRD